MENYKWDHNLIRKLCKDKQIKSEFQYLIDRLEHKPTGRFTTYGQLFDEDLEIFDNYSFVFNLISHMANDSHSPSYQDYEIELSLEKIMHYFYTFIEFLDPEVREITLHALDKKGQLQIKKSNPYYFYSGVTYFSNTAQEHFTEVSKQPNLETLNILAHEFGHVFAFYYRKNMPPSKANHALTEVEGKFWELLIADFCNQIADLNQDAQKAFYNIDDEAINQANALFYKYLLCYTYNMKKSTFANDKEHRELFRYFNHLYGLTKNDHKIILTTPLENTSDYILSYLTSYSLYTLYKKDQQKAWYIFKKIISMEKRYPHEMFTDVQNLGIDFGKEIESLSRRRKRN